jgi:hemerythrin-like domain-containing protein
MKLTLEYLYKDHDNLRRVVCLLDQLLIDIYRGSTKNYPMILPILTYIQDYPARVHHLAEDAVLSVIFKKGVSSRKFREDVNTLMREHSEIEGLIRVAIKSVEPKPDSTPSDIADIGDKLSIFINRKRSHLLFEEMNIYPYFAEYLGSKDWENISALMPDYEDPIFGDKVRKEYEHIFKAL